MENENTSAAQTTSPQTDTGKGTANTEGGGDVLDKGVDVCENKAGLEQSHSTTEKVSDDLREGFQKVTGKDLPIKDKEY